MYLIRMKSAKEILKAFEKRIKVLKSYDIFMEVLTLSTVNAEWQRRNRKWRRFS